ncbi:HHL069Wp [Eremothecium sinecaudum]|uniref:HHL069Wp n=1 Tax=Eremothecium sinecaudum TaxID=45286 RepID=A0A0X8HWB9_9SACH|nr:HHL069Wp [Eremothecium sinecaudum]AMD22701.1 HHL069Wp [Eremothecium sinecaudum]
MVLIEVEEEISAIEAIYPGLLTRLSDSRVLVKIPQYEDISIQLSFPPLYPAYEPPHILEISFRNEMTEEYDVKHLKSLFNEVMTSVFYKDTVCVFSFLAELTTIMDSQQKDNVSEISEVDAELTRNIEEINVDAFSGWVASEPIFDRGSTFIAYAAQVTSEDEAFEIIEQLKSDNKIARAHHLMKAWRIKAENGISYQDCDDDGETAAGSRILHLMTIMDTWNVIVAVARWFRGTHIGPDRFKHINSTAREAVLKLTSPAENNSASTSSKRNTKKGK